MWDEVLAGIVIGFLVTAFMLLMGAIWFDSAITFLFALGCAIVGVIISFALPVGEQGDLPKM